MIILTNKYVFYLISLSLALKYDNIMKIKTFLSSVDNFNDFELF